jgi:hypothetical protein
MYGAIETMKKSNDFNNDSYNKNSQRDLLFKVIFQDIIESTNLSISSKKEQQIDTVYINTKNSLHGLINPTVLYYVDVNNILYRIESLDNNISLPIREKDYRNIKVDEVTDKIEYFRIFPKNRDYLIYLKRENSDKIFFEVSIPFATDTNETNSSGTSQSSKSNSSSSNSASGDAPPKAPDNSLPALPGTPTAPNIK